MLRIHVQTLVFRGFPHTAGKPHVAGPSSRSSNGEASQGDREVLGVSRSFAIHAREVHRLGSPNLLIENSLTTDPMRTDAPGIPLS